MRAPLVVHVTLAAAVAATVSLSSPRTAEASHYALKEIPTVVSAEASDKLAKAGVANTEDLLQKGAKPKDRKALAKASGLKTTEILGLVRRADLLRIKGIGPEMVLLLEASGVHTSAELAGKSAADLMTAVTAANGKKKISEKPPTQDQLQFWIDDAKKQPKVLDEK